ncbi:hypothetical protein [Vibrio sp. 10N.261.55.A7]|uniref:hypothetical protein n=1 Tax=Vibrio sp. 10N.261.55.A7 TaxID=1880851 RepID=UPI000C82BEB6|nr:hypothetical protein [Vibrio sp. 10N.261.55.A7]PMK05024.1 hypothetical protein BCU12_02035 [Vibrio sp. 10N.261.55.A7]
MKVKVVGPYSGQIGGVASYMSRLVGNEKIDEIYDPYTGVVYELQATGKYKVKKTINRVFRYLYIARFCRYEFSEVVFLNFSTIKTLILEFILGKASNRRYIFHNGNPTEVNMLLLYKFLFYIKSIRILSLTENHVSEFHRKFGVITCKDIVYIAPNVTFSLPVKKSDILIAGYAKKLYNIDTFLESVLAQYDLFRDISISVVLYGEPEITVHEKIISIANKLSNVTVYSEMKEDKFLFLLAEHKVYFRPTTMDSYGFTIQDAMSLNCLSYCSSVISRPFGSKVFNLPIDKEVMGYLASMVNNYGINTKELESTKPDGFSIGNYI